MPDFDVDVQTRNNREDNPHYPFHCSRRSFRSPLFVCFPEGHKIMTTELALTWFRKAADQGNAAEKSSGLPFFYFYPAISEFTYIRKKVLNLQAIPGSRVRRSRSRNASRSKSVK